MKRFIMSIVLGLILFGCGWTLYNRNEIAVPTDLFKLARQQLGTLTGVSAREHSGKNSQSPIRIASFNVQIFGNKKSQDPFVIDALVQIVRQFDIVGLQEIRSRDPQFMSRFLEQVNDGKRDYALALGERSGRGSHQEQYAFLYDQETISLDGSRSYSVQDPDDLMRREPLVGWFRANTVDPTAAFTFSLVNLHLDSREPDKELQHIHLLFRAIRNDGRGEDDVILIGDFNSDDRHLQELGHRYGLKWVISKTPTNTRNSQQYDNILFDPLATSEFTGRAGVYNFMSIMNLSLEQALQVSDHLPVWAEFANVEGEQHSHVSRAPQEIPTVDHRAHDSSDSSLTTSYSRKE